MWESLFYIIGLAALVTDWLCLVIRAWVFIFVAGSAAVAYAVLECIICSTRQVIRCLRVLSSKRSLP